MDWASLVIIAFHHIIAKVWRRENPGFLDHKVNDFTQPFFAKYCRLL
jgi:hypothetical protein